MTHSLAYPSRSLIQVLPELGLVSTLCHFLACACTHTHTHTHTFKNKGFKIHQGIRPLPVMQGDDAETIKTDDTPITHTPWLTLISPPSGPLIGLAVGPDVQRVDSSFHRRFRWVPRSLNVGLTSCQSHCSL